MVKRTLGLILAGLMLLPVAAMAAPTTADLAKQIEMLSSQLSSLQAQLEEVQEATDENADSVELLEAGSEKWDEHSRFEFYGDYRFRMDYSDTDTKAFWGAGDIASAVKDMQTVTGMDVQQIMGLMGTFTAAERKGMMENLDMSLAQMGLMQNGLIPGTDAFNAAFPDALAAVNAAGVVGGYDMTLKNNYENDVLYTNRFRLGMKAKVSENLEFKGRLAMYKAWGMQSNPTSNGPYFMNQFTAMDGATTRQPSDSILRVDRAYINWTGVADLPVWFSIGRRPTTDGPPAHLRLGTDKRMATPVNFMDYAFDGATLGAVFDNPFDFMGYSKIRFCYGRGFEAGPTDNANELDDMDFGGLSWDIINKGSRFMNIQAFLAANIVNVPDGVDFVNPLEAYGIVEGNGLLDTENLGDIYHISSVYMDKYQDLDYFLAGGWSRTDPDGVDEMGSTLLGSWWEDPGQKDGYCLYGGVRYQVSDDLKFGLEYNYGTKNWISMTPAHDDMTQAKLATRGHVGEAYMIWNLPVGDMLSDKAKAFMRLGYQHYEYEYTGSGNWLGAPADIDELDDPLNAQFFAPIDSMDQVYLTMEAWF